MKKVCEAVLIKQEPDIWSIKARVRPCWWPFFGEWRFVALRYDGLGHYSTESKDADHIAGIFTMICDNGVADCMNTNYFWPVEKRR